MSRSKAVTFKGTPLTLAGNEVKDGQAAPDFKLNYFEGGMKERFAREAVLGKGWVGP